MSKADPDKAAQIFLNAEVWHASGLILSQQATGALPPAGGLPQFFPAAFAASAFALELYLKALITLEVGKPKGTHNLKTLFDAVRPKTRKLIRDEYDRRTHVLQKAILEKTGHKFDVDYILEQGKDTFELMRYFYDLNKEKRTGSGFQAGTLIDVIREVALGLRPDWPVDNGAPPTFPARSKPKQA